jgi:hypothetical protein
MSVAVVMPYQAGPGRADLLHHVWNRLADDGWPVVIGAPRQERWCKATAVGEAIAQVELRAHAGDVLVVHDADVIVDLAALREAVAIVETGGAGWAIPHTHVVRLSENASEALLRGSPMASPSLARQPYVGVPGGGVVVVPLATYEDTPLDRRFVGWGDEDESWGWALRTLHGEPWRSDASLVHLWHPHAAPGARRNPDINANRLRRAYRAYREDPERMRALVTLGR